MGYKSIVLIRATRGAPLTVLVAMMNIGDPTGANELERLTGITRKTVSKALLILQDLGLVSKTPQRINSYQCAPDVFSRLFDGGVKIPTTGTDVVNVVVVDGAIQSNKRKSIFPDSQSGVKITPPTEQPELLILSDAERKVHSYLYNHGIIDPTAKQIAKSAWCSLEYVKAIIQDGRLRHQQDGLIIHRILNKAPKPELAQLEDYDVYIER